MAKRGVILDVDGTLIDSNDAHARAWVETLAEHGIAVPFEKVRPLIGMGGDKLLPAVTGISEDSPRGQAISTRRGEIFRAKYLQDLQPFPGVRQLLEAMQSRGMRLAVASSATEDDLHALLDKARVTDLIPKRTSSDDAERSKPDPDIVHATLERLALPRDTVAMIGDTPYDIEAAKRAALDAIAFRCGGWWRDEQLVGAIAIYDGPADLLAHLDDSPLAR